MKKNYLKFTYSAFIGVAFLFFALGSGESDSKPEYKNGIKCTKCGNKIPDNERKNNIGYCKDCYYEFYKETMNEMRRDGEIK